MARVFLSYDRDDADRARSVALALEKAGHSVWWDLHVRGGAQFSKIIEEALNAAQAVVVLWSAHSVESAWVRDEAAAGRDRQILIPVCLDKTVPPMGFRQYQTINFTGWKGRNTPHGFDQLLASIEALATETAEPVGSTTLLSESRRHRSLPKYVLQAGALLVMGAGAFWWFANRGETTLETVAVIGSDPAAKPLARELTVDLGTLQSAKSGSMQLLGDNSGSPARADLVFEVAGDPEPGNASANLLLTAGKDKAVLWSQDFHQDSGNVADLKQQMAFTAGRVLGCALEARNAEGRALTQQTLKLYLNACAQLAVIGKVGSLQVISALSQVTQHAPSFEGGWAKLLTAESQSLDTTPGTDQAKRAVLRQHIEASRRIDPDMPEIALAEFVELGKGQFARQGQIIDRASSAHPDNPDVLGFRSAFLAQVGRLSEAIDDSRRSVELDPLSPMLRNEFISTLMNSGRIEAARQELEEANRLWPGTEPLRDIQFRFNLRYGDPKLAAGMLNRSGGPSGGPVLDSYLQARLNPTPENIDKVISSLPANQVHNPIGLANLIQAMGEFHREEALFALALQPTRRADLASISGIFFRPGLAGFRRDPRFMRVANAAGLVDYWRSSGKWPDFCFEPSLPYDCKKEAAKLLS